MENLSFSPLQSMVFRLTVLVVGGRLVWVQIDYVHPVSLIDVSIIY